MKNFFGNKLFIILGFGGYDFDYFRLWIDDDVSNQSYIGDDDGTYEKGSLADYHITKLNVLIIIQFKIF